MLSGNQSTTGRYQGTSPPQDGIREPVHHIMVSGNQSTTGRYQGTSPPHYGIREPVHHITVSGNQSSTGRYQGTSPPHYGIREPVHHRINPSPVGLVCRRHHPSYKIRVTESFTINTAPSDRKITIIPRQKTPEYMN